VAELLALLGGVGAPSPLMVSTFIGPSIVSYNTTSNE
jgi:hypothetical protein